MPVTIVNIELLQVSYFMYRKVSPIINDNHLQQKINETLASQRFSSFVHCGEFSFFLGLYLGCTLNVVVFRRGNLTAI